MKKCARNESVYEAYGGSLLPKDRGHSTRKEVSNDTFEQLCVATDSSNNRSFRIQTKVQVSNSPRNEVNHRIVRGNRQRRDMMSKKTVTVYKECQSSITSYRAKKPVSQSSIGLDSSRLAMARNIEECRVKLAECNTRVQQHIVRVPPMRVLKNLIRKLYEADNQMMRRAFNQWKQSNDYMRQQEIIIRQTAQRIKSTAQDLVRTAVVSATKRVEAAVKQQMLQEAPSTPNIERWNRTKSMYNLTSNFKPRGSVFQLPDVGMYKAKLLHNKKL